MSSRWLVLLGLCACGGKSGACVGTGSDWETDYCYSDFDKGGCRDFASAEVNGAQWEFHPDTTCTDLGLPEL